MQRGEPAWGDGLIFLGQIRRGALANVFLQIGKTLNRQQKSRGESRLAQTDGVHRGGGKPRRLLVRAAGELRVGVVQAIIAVGEIVQRIGQDVSILLRQSSPLLRTGTAESITGGFARRDEGRTGLGWIREMDKTHEHEKQNDDLSAEALATEE